MNGPAVARQPRAGSRPEPLGPGEVHVWRARILPSNDELDRYRPFIADDEWRRASGMPPELARTFLAERWFLRDVLSAYAGATRPRDLRFAVAPGGKPALVGHPLRFSISHSHGLASLAVGRSGEIGLDIELVRPVPFWRSIAGRLMDGHVVEQLAELSGIARWEAFFRHWTRLEALVKASGQGLERVTRDHISRLEKMFSSREFEGPSGWVGSIATSGTVRVLHRGNYVPDSPGDAGAPSQRAGGRWYAEMQT